MTVEQSTHPSGVPLYTVRAGENEYVFSAFGAQLLSWTQAGVPVLFANHEAAVQDGKTAYRGGAPICFPYFGKGLLLPNGTLIEPQHGRARTTLWDVAVFGEGRGLLFHTVQPSAEGYDPTSFRCELIYDFSNDLVIIARIENIGEQPAPFQFVVHSYWATEEPAYAEVTGLGARYLDNRDGYAERTDEDSAAPHLPPFDRVYPDSLSRLTVSTGRYEVEIQTQNTAGSVLWNPGEDHGIADLRTPNFVCVESGLITPAPTLEPGEHRSLTIAYRVTRK